MPYIKTEGQTVIIGGEVKPDDSWVWYDKPIPKGKYLLWNADLEIIVADLNKEKEEKIYLINERFSSEMDNLFTKYPERERDTWPQQEKEAIEHLNNKYHPTPLLDALSSELGINKTVLAKKIKYKSEVFAKQAGTLVGKRKRLITLIKKARSVEELEQIEW